MTVETLYHGSAEKLNRLEIGHCTGEMSAPINGIWFCSEIDGAKHHIINVLPNYRKITVGYIYECRLTPDCVVIDTLGEKIPAGAFRRFKNKYVPWWKWLFVKNKNWFAVTSKKYGYHSNKNRMIEVCRSIGIDALKNPTIYDGCVLNEFYGEQVLLLNCDKIIMGKTHDVEL